MKNKLLLLAAFVALTAGGSGCSTIMNGTKEKISFISNPSGASVFIDGVPVGKTPLTTDIKRGRCPPVDIKLSGYAPQRINMTDSLNAGSYIGGNLGLTLLTLFGVVGFVVDPITGGMWSYDNTLISAELEKETPLPASVQK